MQIIQLEGNENVVVIRDLLERAMDSEVLLVVPKGCEALEKNQVNLTVLRRWADSLALCIALVIEDRETRIVAAEAGFVVLPSVEEAQQTPGGLARLDRKRRRHEGLPARPVERPLLPRRSRVATRRPGETARRLSFPSWLLALAVFVVLGGFLFLALPGATVTLTPISEPVQASMSMSAVAGLTDVNFGQAQVPARTMAVEREGNDTVETTDKRDVPDGHAEGSVIFANKTTVPVTITKGTVVRTSFGETVRFYTVADVWLPGELHRTVRVGILAAEPGPTGNVPALTINGIEGELAAQADVLNDARTTGGTVRRMSTVSGDDKVRLRAKLVKRLQEEAYQDLIAGLKSDEFIPPESLDITALDEEFDHNVGDMFDTLGMKMKVKVTGLAVSGEGGHTLLLRLLEQRMKSGYHLIPDSAQFEQGAVTEATQEGASFGMDVRASIAPAIEPKAIQAALAGKTPAEAKALLAREFKLKSEPKIELSGSLFGRLPWIGARIRVRVTTG